MASDNTQDSQKRITIEDEYYLEELADEMIKDQDLMFNVALAVLNDPDFAKLVLKSKRLREYVPPEQDFTLAHFAVYKHEQAAVKALEDPEVYEIRSTTGETVALMAIRSHRVIALSAKDDPRICALITNDGKPLERIINKSATKFLSNPSGVAPLSAKPDKNQK